MKKFIIPIFLIVCLSGCMSNKNATLYVCECVDDNTRRFKKIKGKYGNLKKRMASYQAASKHCECPRSYMYCEGFVSFYQDYDGRYSSFSRTSYNAQKVIHAFNQAKVKVSH